MKVCKGHTGMFRKSERLEHCQYIIFLLFHEVKPQKLCIILWKTPIQNPFLVKTNKKPTQSVGFLFIIRI